MWGGGGGYTAPHDTWGAKCSHHTPTGITRTQGVGDKWRFICRRSVFTIPNVSHRIVPVPRIIHTTWYYSALCGVWSFLVNCVRLTTQNRATTAQNQQKLECKNRSKPGRAVWIPSSPDRLSCLQTLPR